MSSMTIKELFNVGTTFESAIGLGTKEERARIPKNYSRINLTEEMETDLKNFPEEINFLVSGEIWCPDFQLNATVIKKFTELNPKFEMSVITTARGRKFLGPIIECTDLKFPIIVVLDKDFNILGTFIERPRVVSSHENFEEIKMDYLKGKYLLNSAEEFYSIMKKIL